MFFMRNARALKTVVRKLNGSNHLGDLAVNEMIILKCMLKKQDGIVKQIDLPQERSR
jgi:hypothetical protein